MMKKITALFLAMCLCMTAFSAMAGGDPERDQYRYKPYNPGQSGTLVTPYLWETQFNPLDAIRTVQEAAEYRRQQLRNDL